MISETGHSYPAELFDDLLRECGGEALVNALDAHRSALAAWEAAERFRRGKAGLMTVKCRAVAPTKDDLVPGSIRDLFPDPAGKLAEALVGRVTARPGAAG